MPLHHLEHFLIQPDNLEETAAWWCDVLGLEEGPHPDKKLSRATVRSGAWLGSCRSHRIPLYRTRGNAGALAQKISRCSEKTCR